MFSISLTEIEKNPAFSIPYSPEYSEEDDDISFVVLEICCYLLQIDCAKFVIQGFEDIKWAAGSSECWPADLEYGLSTIIDELPNVVHDLRKRLDSSIYLWEQGVEKKIIIHINGESAELSCLDYIEHKTIPLECGIDGARSLVPDKSSVVEKMPVEALIKMIEDLINEFIRLAIKYCVNIEENTTFQKYMRDWKSAQ